MQNIKYFQTVPIEQCDVVLVDENDQRLGTMNILEAHKHGGVMHRAISVLLHDGAGRVLLQKRSKQKPLWPLFWSNTVCTHPIDREEYVDCAVRRLKEEMGIKVNKDELEVMYRFKYQARFDDQLSEFELDTVLVGQHKGNVDPDPDEVADHRWVKWVELHEEIQQKPDKFTPWFKKIVKDKRVNRRLGRVVEI